MPNNPNAVDNLKPYQPGQPSSNPSGRPKGLRNRATILMELMNTKIDAVDPFTKKKKRMEIARVLDITLLQMALNKDTGENAKLKAIEMVKEQIYGKIPQDLNIGGQDDNPVVVEEKVTKLTVVQRLIIKYGIESEQVRKYQEKYGKPEDESDIAEVE